MTAPSTGAVGDARKREACGECGPGYWIGGDGCRHQPADTGWTCPDCDGEFPADHPAVRALIAEAVQAERERIAAAIEWEAGGREAQALHARDEDVEFFGSKQRLTAEVKALRDAARIARDGGR